MQVRLRPDLSDAERDRTIALIRAATRMPDFRLANGKGEYVVSGAPVVLSSLTSDITSSIKLLLVAALIVMALTLLPLPLAAAPRRTAAAARRRPGAPWASLFGAMALVGAASDHGVDRGAADPRRARRRLRDPVPLAPRRGHARGGPRRAEAAVRAAALGGPTIATAGLATAAGFLVLLLSPVPMVRGFGLLLVIGIALAFACALTAGFAGARARPAAASRPGAPALPATAGRRGRVAAAGRGARDSSARSRARWGAVSRGSRAWARAMRAAVARPAGSWASPWPSRSVGFVADTQTRVVSDVQKLVPQDSPALRDLDTLQRETGVSGEIDVTVEADDLTDPQVIKWMTGYQAAVLKRFGYSEKRGCRQAAAVPGALAAQPVPRPTRREDRARDPRPARRRARRTSPRP